MAKLPASSDLQTDAFPVGSASSIAKAGLSPDTKKQLGISAAVLLLGGAALAFMPKKPGTDPVPGDPVLGNTPLVLPPNAEEACSVNDQMSFDTAFATARKEVGSGGVFVWHNKPYNTFLREEWSGLSLQQRQEYAEHVLGAELPLTVQQPVTRTTGQSTLASSAQAVDPTVIEGQLGERRVMGIDQDNDGVIDVLVIEGEDGYTYTVADAGGDQGLDTMYVYDAVKDEYILAAKLDEPIVLTNDNFSGKLEDAMSREVADAIMADYSDEPVDVTVESETIKDETEEAETTETETSESEAYEEDGFGDTYVNNASVSEMDDPHQ